MKVEILMKKEKGKGSFHVSYQSSDIRSTVLACLRGNLSPKHGKGKENKGKRQNYLRGQLRKQSMKTGEHIPHLLPPLSLRPYVSLMLRFTTTLTRRLPTPASLPTPHSHTRRVLNGAI